MHPRSEDPDPKIAELARDVLHHRTKTRYGDVAFLNAFHALRRYGAAALPDIEAVVKQEAGGSEAERPLGTDSLMQCYFRIARDAGQTDRSRDFLGSLTGDLKALALGAIWTLTIGLSRQPPIPQELLHDIQQLAKAQDRKVAKQAQHLLAAYVKIHWSRPKLDEIH